jgi:hypothetical protein
MTGKFRVISSHVLFGRERYSAVASTLTDMETPMDEFPDARRPLWEIKVKGDIPSATPISMSRRSNGR